MPLGHSRPRQEPLHVFWMALALAFAAFVGAAAGLLWHAVGIGEEDASGEEASPEEPEPAPPAPSPAPNAS